ncbi:MAG: hypothetical protein IPM53_33605 [Anaerolineaceae bacterium]|nr:hypothetical protein [Anaerolineaceae bacterium]
MNREKAVQFIQQNGNEVELARLRYLLDGKRPSPDIVKQLFRGQREDGGFAPFWAPGYSSVDATCFRLAQAEQLGLDTTEIALVDALRFLLWRQEADGRFAEHPSVADSAPPWAAPGNLAAELYLTANAGFWLAFWHFTSAAQEAVNFLGTHLDETSHRLPSFAQAQWLACGLAWKLGQHELVDHLASHLYAELPQTAGELAWMLVTLRSVGFPSDSGVAVAGLARLAEMQEEDGRFPSDEGQHVHTTLEAVRAYKKWDADHPDSPDFFDQ